MQLTIRQGVIEDENAITAIDHIARVDCRRVAFIQRNLANGSCFICEMDGALVGYAVLDYSFFEHGMIVMLYTKDENRRCGVASALLRQCEIACVTPKLFASTNRSNKPMQALLLKNGFVPSGIIENLDDGDPEQIYFKRLKT